MGKSRANAPIRIFNEFLQKTAKTRPHKPAVFAPVRTAPFLPLHAPSSRIWALPLLPGIVRCPPSVFRDHPGPRFQIIRPDGEYPSHFCPVRQTSLSAEIIMMHFPSNNAQVQSNIFPPFSQCRNRKKHKRFKKNTHSICSGYPGGNFGERQAGRKAAEKDCSTFLLRKGGFPNYNGNCFYLSIE